MKYCVITFFLWLVGGWCGLHHFYLGRDKHGFLWATSWGGFLIGWMKEFTSLSRYTEEANNGYPIRAARKPNMCSELHRILGFIIFGCFYRMLIVNAIPSTINGYHYIVLLLAPLGMTFGAYMVANIGHVSCSIKYPLVGSYLGEMCLGQSHLFIDGSNIVAVSLITAIVCIFGWRERQKNISMSFLQRFSLWAGLGLLVLSLWGCYGYYNAEVYVEELGGNMKVRDLVRIFFSSEQWANLKIILKDVFWTLWESGWDHQKAYENLTRGVFETQLIHAKKIMGFNKIEELTERELKVSYKKLAREWHPDKHSDPGKKAYAQEQFIEIQEAYVLLERYMKRRTTSH